ncbi:MAG: type 1 glutamine amidotransferase [Chloroflexi bacterium]|nr:type 1 glutamine amidotransferase [Chloroflexota bacterium]
MAKVLILVDEGVEDREMAYPYYRLQEAGYRVEVVGPERGKTYTGGRGLPFLSDLAPDDVRVDDYAAVIVPGGKAPDHLRTIPRLVEIVREAVERGKVVAAICHGPQMLIEADVLRGRRATCAPQIKTDLKNAGALYSDEPVVVDGNLITSRFPPDLPAFGKAVVEALARVPAAAR